MSATPETLTHGFSLHTAKLAHQILQGGKIIENRNFRLRPGWYAVCVSKSAKPDLTLKMPGGKAYGAAFVGYSVESKTIENEWKVESYRICNVITKTMVFAKPIAVRCNLGNFPLKGSTEAVRAAAVGQDVRATGAEKEVEKPSLASKKCKKEM
jgi:hypothetical protein